MSRYGFIRVILIVAILAIAGAVGVSVGFSRRQTTKVRESDVLGRYGGEEFIVLLPDTDRRGRARLAEKLREAIDELEIPDLDRRLSASFGVATLPGDAVNGEQLLRAADRALYAAKRAGRNRVEIVNSSESRDQPPESGRLDDDLVPGG